MKVGNSPKDGQNHTGSWRQAILHRVVTPSKNNLQTPELLSPLRYQRKFITVFIFSIKID